MNGGESGNEKKKENFKVEITFNMKCYCLTKISIRAKRSIFLVVSSPFFCTLPVQRSY